MLLNFILSNSISQFISQATRPTLNSILVLIMTSSPNLIENMQTVPGISDHHSHHHNSNQNQTAVVNGVHSSYVEVTFGVLH